MAVPDYQSLMLPALRVFADGDDHSSEDVRSTIAKELKLTSSELDELLPSGTQPLFHNRVHWALWYLQKAGLTERVRRGTHRIAARGREILASNPKRIDLRLLDQFPEIRELRRRDNGAREGREEPVAAENVETPEAMLARAYAVHRRAIEDDVIARLHAVSPSRFEAIVIELLVAMGYGGSFSEAAERIGRSGDGGLDGVIKEDRLGLDVVCVQAKRWKDTVGRPSIQAFAGSLQGARARKGIFITTSKFSKEALEYAERIDTRIVLIDGITLARFMFEHDVGVNTAKEHVYAVKRIDEAFFEEG